MVREGFLEEVGPGLRRVLAVWEQLPIAKGLLSAL